LNPGGADGAKSACDVDLDGFKLVGYEVAHVTAVGVVASYEEFEVEVFACVFDAVEVEVPVAPAIWANWEVACV